MRLQTPVLDERRVRDVRRMLLTDVAAPMAEYVASLTPAELADLLVELSPIELARLEPLVGTERVADAIAELDPSEAARLLLRFTRADAADILEEMEPDDAVDVVEELGDRDAADILAEMEVDEADEIRDLMAYPSDTAGGRMTPEYVAISPSLTVAVAMRQIRAQAPDAEQIYYIYVIDRADRLMGVVSLRDLVMADPQRRIGEVMRHQVIRVPAEVDQEAAARLLLDHDFLALPVVASDGRLLGVLTADDLADVLEEEATEDIERLGGSEPLDEPYLRAPLAQLFRKRVVWLMVLFLAGTYTTAVLQTFADTLDKAVALAFFIPLLIGTGGNVGSQIVTTVVRAMAVGDVSMGDLWHVWRREIVVSLCVGLVMGSAMFVRALTMGVDFHVGVIVAAAALIIVGWSASIAAILPLVLRRFHVDPAVVSAPLITTLVDGTGLFLYLTIARVVLGI
jgi:magnesium transporter